jgi:hypothetical protein
VLIRSGKSVYESQWLFFFFFRKRKRTKKKTPGCAFFGERLVPGLGYCCSEKVNAGLER